MANFPYKSVFKVSNNMQWRSYGSTSWRILVSLVHSVCPWFNEEILPSFCYFTYTQGTMLMYVEHGCIFFWKILIFPKPVLCVVFEILKLPENFSPKLGYFQKKMRKICKKWGKITKIKDSEQKIGKNCIF